MRVDGRVPLHIDLLETEGEGARHNEQIKTFGGADPGEVSVPLGTDNHPISLSMEARRSQSLGGEIPVSPNDEIAF
eukprot:9467525-Pyramimonas_sp.AAC.1